MRIWTSKLAPVSVSLFALAVLGLAAPLAHAQTYKVDPAHSFINFKINHLGVSNAWGRFDGPTGTVMIDQNDPSKSNIHIEARTDKVDTGVEKRDAHLKSPDFFNAKQFPTLAFQSKSVKKSGDNALEVSGELTFHGVTKPITVTVTKVGEADTQMGPRAGWETNFTVKRSDFGMSGMVGPVGDDVQVWVNIEAVKQ
jgi:polyisoprenoid-binding protein YceI